MKETKRKVGKYELGRTIGEGTFAKVKFAQNMENGKSAAIKVIAKTTILKHKMVDQVLSSHTKIYIVLELFKGGELFDKITRLEGVSAGASRFAVVLEAVGETEVLQDLMHED